MAAEKILRCYPDYGKAPAEYVVNLMAVLERYSVNVITQLADVQRDLPCKCKFPPTPADVVEMADPLAELENRPPRPWEGMKPLSMDDYQNLRLGRPLGYSEGFRPFPKLWAAFEGDDEATNMLNSGLSFDKLFDFSRTLATESRAACRDKLVPRKAAAA